MEFRVLGPLKVIASDPVELASGQQVALFSCLLMAGDEACSRDRLIDALWGEQPPATAANALQVQVHALRRRLGAGAKRCQYTSWRIWVTPKARISSSVCRRASRSAACWRSSSRTCRAMPSRCRRTIWSQGCLPRTVAR